MNYEHTRTADCGQTFIDLACRKGLDNVWDSFGQGIRDDIRNEWINIVETVLENDKSS